VTSSKSAATAANGRALAAGISAVWLYVRDLDRSLAFYRDVLGLPLVRDERDAGWAEAHLPGGVRFALHRSHEGAEPQTPGTMTIDFGVADLDAAVARVRAAGARVDRIMRESWGSAATVFDPDGYRISLYQAPSARE
jgi:predicted enzyme related to lactoylglutathione lyase